VRRQNLRFHFEECGSGVNRAGEKVKPSANEVREFKAGLSRLGDVFVFEGFGAAHRPHASIVGCSEPGSLIRTRVSGLLVEKEIAVFAGTHMCVCMWGSSLFRVGDEWICV
jgi:phosphoglycerate kinase